MHREAPKSNEGSWTRIDEPSEAAETANIVSFLSLHLLYSLLLSCITGQVLALVRINFIDVTSFPTTISLAKNNREISTHCCH
jgi:hypothetical protein